MAELTNPQLINFTNEQARQLADQVSKLDRMAAAGVQTYSARDLGTIINDGGASNLISDGSAIDGRTRCTGGDVFNIVTLLNDFAAFMTQGRKDVIAKWRVNG